MSLSQSVRQYFHQQLNAVGQSKYKIRNQLNKEARAQAAAAGNEKPDYIQQSPYIHGASTFGQYLSICERAAEAIEAEHPEARKYKYAAKKGYVKDYYESLVNSGNYSPSSLSLFRAALSKGFDIDCDDVGAAPVRHIDEFTRDRSYDAARLAHDLDIYHDMAVICLATGCRECELKTLRPEHFMFTEDGNCTVSMRGKGSGEVHTKGGRPRIVHVLPDHVQELRAVIEAYEPGQLIAPEVPQRLSCHGIRAVFANEQYESMARDIEECPRAERYYCRNGGAGKCFDRVAMAAVSAELGHNRESVTREYLVR